MRGKEIYLGRIKVTPVLGVPPFAQLVVIFRLRFSAGLGWRSHDLILLSHEVQGTPEIC